MLCPPCALLSSRVFPHGRKYLIQRISSFEVHAWMGSCVEGLNLSLATFSSVHVWKKLLQLFTQDHQRLSGESAEHIDPYFFLSCCSHVFLMLMRSFCWKCALVAWNVRKIERATHISTHTCGKCSGIFAAKFACCLTLWCSGDFTYCGGKPPQEVRSDLLGKMYSHMPPLQNM